jgi:hypothetical protein
VDDRGACEGGEEESRAAAQQRRRSACRQVVVGMQPVGFLEQEFRAEVKKCLQDEGVEAQSGRTVKMPDALLRPIEPEMQVARCRRQHPPNHILYSLVHESTACDKRRITVAVPCL